MMNMLEAPNNRGSEMKRNDVEGNSDTRQNKNYKKY